jgi:hypothetical protein
MKKTGILLAILLVAGVCAMADEASAIQGNALFADVDAVALSQAEMQAVDGDGFFGAIGRAIAGAFAAGAVNGGIAEAIGVDPWEAGNKAGNGVVKSLKKGYDTYCDTYYAPKNAKYRGWAAAGQGY